jgi:hypothetical protein
MTPHTRGSVSLSHEQDQGEILVPPYARSLNHFLTDCPRSRTWFIRFS